MPPPLPTHVVNLKTQLVNDAVQELKKLLLRGEVEHVVVVCRRKQIDTPNWEFMVSSITYPAATEET